MQEKPNSRVAVPPAARVPQFEQVAGRAAGGGDHRVARLRRRVQRADQLPLAHRLAGHRDVDLVAQLVRPCVLRRRDLRAVGGLGRDARRRLCQGGERFTCISDDRQRALLVGVVRADIDGDEPNIGVLEGGLRAGSEVGQPRADGDHEVRVADESARRRACR